MAGGKERVLRRRIRSVQTTKKITKAMELIAASRIVKSQQRVLAARPYADQITEVIRNLAAAGAGAGAPLLAQREQIDTIATIVIGGDRGLCGGYNTNAIRMAERNQAAQRREGKQTALFAVGRKVGLLLPVPQGRRRGFLHRLPRRAATTRTLGRSRPRWCRSSRTAPSTGSTSSTPSSSPPAPSGW